jgi:UDP-galactopyranose mutase
MERSLEYARHSAPTHVPPGDGANCHRPAASPEMLDRLLGETPTHDAGYDLLCFSHLRWDFVYQRPQHLMSRCARRRRVFFIEEPQPAEGVARMEVRLAAPGVWVAVPHVPEGAPPDEWDDLQRVLLDDLLVARGIRHYVCWYYTPMALAFSDHLTPLATVYDCMDELSAFAGAPPLLRAREAELFRRADLVFTGGQSLYEAKRTQHPRVYAFPSSVDRAHFAQARAITEEPPDQAAIPRPRLGFFGVIDERMDRDLVAGIAAARPDWKLVIIGPVAKIDPADLPQAANIHYLGMKSYAELPAYLAGWDVALLPFARNASTRFISPTKTPEYLAAGAPVVSTPITDVVRPYGERGLVRIAETPAGFVAAIEAALAEDRETRLRAVDGFLARQSWDRTWEEMARLIEEVVAAARQPEAVAATGSGIAD